MSAVASAEWVAVGKGPQHTDRSTKQTSVLRSMASTRVDDFSWREVEKQLASFTQNMVEIDGSTSTT